ncbi:cytochrome c oxidase subunit II [Lihuaxuella thermophila]|uniref:Cytochrome c oxidase subunit 2 n=1 Tax=Lihuaxuella thermophila TaxID=1173111 RepID=A0A1H8IXV2_9BACL|nr:cytochrome c oxidase subunit II [Lihuaxuella thermophila]SEN73169.1 cytochrome c oxidase subunit 2 [Lihuaxuella thermophila]
MSRQRLWRALLVFSLAALALSGCSGDPSLNVLEPSGTAGEKQLNLIMWSFFLMLGVFAVVITIFVYVLIRFRKRKGQDRMPEQTHGSTLLEIVWTVIPIVLLGILAVPTVNYTFELADAKPDEDSIRVKVTGHQYWWEFEYPDLGVKTAQELYIPVGKKVHLEIHGKDVLHSFWVPALGGKTDVIPGRVNTMWLDAKKPGKYQGKCAELCGAGHALMDFVVYAKEPAEFDKWVAQMKQPAKVATAAQKEGEQLFLQNCMGCHAGVNPKLQGPDLSKFGTRTTIAGILPHTEENLKKWLKNPEAVKPGAKMPKIDYLTQEELDALTEYLMSRK